ncbi:DUF1648 domain-containing protein [Actinoallomurus sp. CA-142502]|uniref:DUF1648 domain-containing protein n=1 Tax=Actinoallomurus sp. CA-142502 TaxID=3239885 RepID=UPI003D8B76C6
MSPAVVTVIPVVLVGVMKWLMPSLVPPTIPFGVRVPRDRADAPVVVAQRRRYRAVTGVVAVLAVAGTLLAGRPWAGLAVVGVELAVGVFCYLYARRRIAEVKAAEHWFGGRRQVVVADTSLRTEPERYPWPWAVPAVVLALATVIIGIVAYPDMPARLAMHFGPAGRPDRYAAKSFVSAFGPVVTQVASTILLLAVAGAALHSRAQLDAEDPQAAPRHRQFVAATTRALLVLAACTGVTFLFGSLANWQLISPPASVVTALNVVPGVLGAAAVLVVAIRFGQGGSRLRLAGSAAGRARTVNREDDRLYRLGIFYYNPDDPAMLVPKRFGIGWTLNMARPATWVIFGLLLVMALIGVLAGR